MANFIRPSVYTGVNAQLSVMGEDGIKRIVAYVTDFTLDLSAESEDFNVIGQRFGESIPTYNTWTASSNAKASFQNRGQVSLLHAYQGQEFIFCDFILNNGIKSDGTIDNAAIVKASGFASVESLSIDAGSGVTGFAISLKGTGELGFTLPVFVEVTGVEIEGDGVIDNELDMVVGNSLQLSGTIQPTNATNRSLIWDSSAPTVVVVDRESGFIRALSAGSATITATAYKDDGTAITDTVDVTVTA